MHPGRNEPGTQRVDIITLRREGGKRAGTRIRCDCLAGTPGHPAKPRHAASRTELVASLRRCVNSALLAPGMKPAAVRPSFNSRRRSRLHLTAALPQMSPNRPRDSTAPIHHRHRPAPSTVERKNLQILPDFTTQIPTSTYANRALRISRKSAQHPGHI